MEQLLTQPQMSFKPGTLEDDTSYIARFKDTARKAIDQERLAIARHQLAEEAEKIAHGATILVTATKFATGSQQLEIPEAAIAATTLALSFFHAAHHKYMQQQAQKML